MLPIGGKMDGDGRFSTRVHYMNRTDRLLAIILELQAKSWQRAEDLAATFEISKRTVYRDMQALAEAGVPVVSSPGQGYRLDEGYFLPPLSFTTAEAICLILGCDFVAQKFDAQYHASAQSALRKLDAVLADRLRDEIHDLQNSLRFLDFRSTPEQSQSLAQLRRAILDRRRIEIAYETRYTDAEQRHNRRKVDPYGLIYIERAWYLVGYCHLRQAIRHFRLDRIDSLKVLDAPFERPADYDVTRLHPPGRDVEIQVLFTHEVKRWVKEERGFYATRMEDHPDGLLVTLGARREEEVIPWLLGWGANVRVLAPERLQRLMAEQAEAILQQYKVAETLLP